MVAVLVTVEVESVISTVGVLPIVIVDVTGHMVTVV